MLAQQLILVVEPEPIVAEGLCLAIAKLGGVAIGPVRTVSEALALLETRRIAAAILEANLADRDVTPVARLLVRRGVPFVIHSAVTIPPALKSALPEVTMVLKPHEPERVVTRLVEEMRRTNDHHTLFPPGRHRRPRPRQP
jgi:DNA-binding response OmpR family regulator